MFPDAVADVVDDEAVVVVVGFEVVAGGVDDEVDPLITARLKAGSDRLFRPSLTLMTMLP
jgi:hypothetical protein